jgi:MFS family permease
MNAGRQRIINLVATMATLAFCNIAVGLMVQTIPLAMEAQGLSARMIGFNTSFGQLGVFLGGMSLPFLTRRISSKLIAIVAILVLLSAFLAFAFSKPLYAWYGIRFASGFGIAAIFTLSETWITIAAGTKMRARVMGIYTSMLTVTFGVAPFVVAATGFTSSLPWLMAAAIAVPALLAIPFVNVEAHDQSDLGSSFVSVLRKAPAIYACILATTTFEAIMLSFFTIYGMRNGLDYKTASQILGTGIVACLLLFYPTGQLADRWSRGKTATLCASIAVVFAALTAFTINTVAIWPVTIILRAGAFGVYIVALTCIGDRFKGTELVSASALVAVIWGIGGTLGAPLAGAVIDSFGINTLPWIMALCYVAALLALGLNRWTLVPKHSS